MGGRGSKVESRVPKAEKGVAAATNAGVPQGPEFRLPGWLRFAKLRPSLGEFLRNSHCGLALSLQSNAADSGRAALGHRFVQETQ